MPTGFQANSRRHSLLSRSTRIFRIAAGLAERGPPAEVDKKAFHAYDFWAS